MALVVFAVLALALGALLTCTSSHQASRAMSGSNAKALSPVARLAVSRGLGAELPEYGIVRSADGFLAHSAGQRLTASFTQRGAAIRAREGNEADIALRAVRFGAAAQPIQALARPLAHGNRVEYRRGGVTEWFANGPAGVEQGFEIAAPRAVLGSGQLTLTLGVSGTLSARHGASGTLLFVGADGKAMLRYSDLSVTDARGKRLPAHMAVAHGRVLISVDTRGARYPLTVDPLINQVGELYASDGVKEAELGDAVAASGSTVVVGDSTALRSGIEVGVAYVFTEGEGGWATATQVAKLMSATPQKEEEFGTSVAVSGSTIVVGAPGREGHGGFGGGAAFVYSEPAGGWGAVKEDTQAIELLNSEDVAEYQFGQSVAISGETIVVGSPQYRDYTQNLVSPPAEGAAFVFIQPAGGWSGAASPTYQTDILDIHEAEGEEHITHVGESVAIAEQGNNQTIVVGAPGAQVGAEFDKYRRGTVLLFDRPDEGWSNAPDRQFFPSGKLIASDSNEFAELGKSVSASGDVIAAGARYAEVEGIKHGAAYVFTSPAAGWSAVHEQSQAAELVNPGTSESDEFGRSVAVEGSTVAVAGLAKNIFLFAMPSGGWSGEQHQSAEFTAGPKSNETGIFDVALGGGEVFAGRLSASPPEEKGIQFQGAVDVVPYAPLIITDGPTGVTGHGASVVGTLNPDQTTVTACTFQYGTTAAYGSEVPCSSFRATGTVAESVTASLTGLEEGVTYHYRAVASNSVDTSYGSDETFTPQGPADTGGTPEATTSTTPSTTTTTAATPQPSAALACTTAQVALINVIQKGSHVLITGAARLVLAGKRVSIRFLATGKTVATATIGADGDFSASAPLPPAKIRGGNRARYEAVVGSLHSLNLKLERRMYMTSVTSSGGHVALSGYVTGSFKAGGKVKILLRVTCSKEDVVATVKLTRSGRFSATVAAPTGAASQIAVYRATTTVLDHGHPEATYTLPTPPTA
jgi:FG-GAP repeat